jgi:hypothetical protein
MPSKIIEKSPKISLTRFHWLIQLICLACLFTTANGVVECYHCAHTGGNAPEADVEGCDSGTTISEFKSIATCEGEYCLKMSGMSGGLWHVLRTCAGASAYNLMKGHNNCMKQEEIPTFEFKLHNEPIDLTKGMACICNTTKCNGAHRNHFAWSSSGFTIWIVIIGLSQLLHS